LNLILGIPSAGNPAKPFVESLKTLAFPEHLHGFDNVTVTGNFAPAQRELIARHALRVNADYLFMVDDDIVLPADALVKLFHLFEEREDCGIAGALYYARDGIRPMAVASWDPGDTTTAYTPAFAHEPVQVDGVGFGCVLIKCDILRTIAEPYFQAQVFLEETLRRARVCNEDYLFCNRARMHGFATYLHAGVRAGHHDRATGVTFPVSWEGDEATNTPRMTVLRPDGTYALVPFDEALPRVNERHLRCELDYIIER
jgi:GT2 family glycosyltransferase